MRKLFYLILVLNFGCSSDDGMNDSNCDLDLVNTKFAQINGQMSYSDIENLLEIPGNNFRTDNLGPSGEMKFYRWVFCDGAESFECWIINDERLHLKTKNFSNNSCSSDVNQSNYSAISIGDSLSQISSLLGNQGDNIRTDYDEQSEPYNKIFRWYNCTDSSDYIEVWFDFNSNAYLINKSF